MLRLDGAASRAIALATLVACSAPRPPVEAAPAAAADRVEEASHRPIRHAVASGGRSVVAYHPDPDPIPLNEPFEVELRIAHAADPARPVEGAQVYVTGWMPDHEHGMATLPETTELGGGTYRARGLLFHMPGDWELRVDVVVEREPERATFEVRLE